MREGRPSAGERLTVRNIGTGLGIVFASLLVSVGAARADASTRFAAPDGDGADPCEQADPCDIYDAVGGAPAGARVAALAGTYEITSVLNVQDGVTLQGPYSGSPAVLQGDGTAGPAVRASGPGTRLTDLAIRQTAVGVGVEIGSGALGDRLDSTGSGSGAVCEPTIGGLLRDSLCASDGSGNGVLVDESAAMSAAAELTNVTAVSSGSGQAGAALRIRASGGAGLEVYATSVIAYAMGSAPDVVATAPGGSSADLILADSNFDNVSASAPATVTSPTTNGNQSGSPLFTDAAAGDFSEAAGSPTIDQGTTAVATLGLLDLLRGARIGGSAPDVGATEFVPPPDTRAPSVSIVSAPKGKIKTKRRYVDVSFELASDEAGVTFECRLNREDPVACVSPVAYRLRATKGVGTTYLLTVHATDAAGNRSGKAIRQVQVIRRRR